MNQVSQYIFNLYHYLLNLRDTMEYVIDREHKLDVYNNRKNVITKGKEEGSAFGNFFNSAVEEVEHLSVNVIVLVNSEL